MELQLEVSGLKPECCSHGAANNCLTHDAWVVSIGQQVHWKRFKTSHDQTQHINYI
jgi:hypothetical protein